MTLKDSALHYCMYVC